MADSLSPSAVVSILDFVGEDEDLFAGVWLRSPNQLFAGARRLAERAELSPVGLCVHAAPDARLAAAASALLTLHMTLMRRRTPTQHRVAAAYRLHGTVTAAARALDCSHQSAGKTLERAGVHATARTRDAFRALFEIAAREYASH